MNNPKFKPEHQIKNPYIKNIDKDFYDGFGLEIWFNNWFFYDIY